MNNHQTLTPAPREHDSAPPPLPHDPKHNATHIDLRTTWKHTAFPAPRNILQAPKATQRRTVIRRSPNTSRTGPSVREHHEKLPRIMASARPIVRLPPRAPRNRSTARHNKPTHATAPTKRTCVSTTRVPQHYQRYCDAMPILLAHSSNVRTTHMLILHRRHCPMTPSTTRPTSTYAQHGSTQPFRRRATSYRHPTRHNVEPSSDVPRTAPALAHPSASTTRNYPASWPPHALVRLPTRAPRNRSTTRHNKPTHATAPTKHTCVSTTRVPQHYQRYCDAMPILLAHTSNVRTTHMLILHRHHCPMTPSTTQPTSTYAQHGSTQPFRRRATSYRHPTRHNVEPSSDVPRTPPALAHPSASTTRNYPASWPPHALVRLLPRAPRNRSTTRHNKPAHATAPTKRTCVSTTRVPQHYQRYCDAMPILLARTSNVRTTHMLTYLYPVYTTCMVTHIATISIAHLL